MKHVQVYSQGTRRASGTHIIPEEIQEHMRNRLRMLRESRGMLRSKMNTVSASSIQKYETRDISSLRLGDIYSLSLEYNISMDEMINYLVGDTPKPRTAVGQRMQRINVYLSSLSDSHQELACDIVQKLVAHTVDESIKRTVDNSPGVKRNSKNVVQDALAAELSNEES